MQNRVGQQFGNYRLLHLLGKGGFAEVYLGEHIHMRLKAAIKVLYGPLTAGDAQRFLQEARTLAALDHPNIVGIKECAIQQDIPFLVVNYAPNGTLRQRHTKGQPVPLETIVFYVRQVASALQYAHDRSLVHRDVKPENMLIDQNNQILLSDFGIAVLTASSHSSVSRGPAGTYFYMAPEQITSKSVPASDQYALGITVYEWICGEVPFVGSMTEITAKHLHVPPPSFRDKGSVIEPQVEAVIRRALEKDPRQRFASVQEFALALQSSSTAQQSKHRHSFAPNRKDSIVLSPFDQTPGFTQDSVSSSLSVQPRPTPRITPQVDASLSGLPVTRPAPTIYQNTPSARTEPARQYLQPRSGATEEIPQEAKARPGRPLYIWGMIIGFIFFGMVWVSVCIGMCIGVVYAAFSFKGMLPLLFLLIIPIGFLGFGCSIVFTGIVGLLKTGQVAQKILTRWPQQQDS